MPIDASFPAGDGEMAARIRGHDWAATPLGPVEGWPARLRLMVEQVLASPLVATLACGPGLVLLYNDAAARLYGGRHPAALGRPLPQAFPEGWATVAPLYARALAGESVQVAAQPLDTRGEGDPAADAFDAVLVPVREEDGRVAYVHMTGFEVGARGHVEASLRASEASLRTVLVGINEPFYALDRDWRFLFASQSALQLWGKDAEDVVGRTLLEAFPQVAGSEAHDAHRRVMRNGKAERLETVSPVIGRWIEIDFAPTPQGGLSVAFRDIEARRRAERRQTFLLGLSDALRPLADAAEMERTAMRLLGEELGVDRAFFATVDADGETWSIRHDYANSLPSHAGRYPMSEFQRKRLPQWRAGRMSSVADSEADPTFGAADRAAYAAFGARAAIGVPLVKGGRFAALLSVNQTGPREWSEAELALTSEVAERTWTAIERARAEEQLRESEERLQQFGEASSDVLWIRDAESLSWTYLSPAFEAIYGLSREAALGGDDLHTWAGLIVPEDRERALENIRRAGAGERVVFEYRVRRPVDGQVRWLRNTDFPIRDAQGRVQAIGGVGHDATEEKRTQELQNVLITELQHRTRNLLGVVRSIAGRTLEAGEALDEYDARLAAVGRVQGFLSRSQGRSAGLIDLVEAELRAHADGQAERIEIAGPPVELPGETAQALALALHELATNAVKHGALAQASGRLGVRWTIEGGDGAARLVLDWQESRVAMPAAPPSRRGYGRELIERALPYQLRAETKLEFGNDGVRCRVVLPLG